MLRGLGYLCYLAGILAIGHAAVSAVLILGEFYSSVAADPLGDAGNDPEQVSRDVLRALLPAALALPTFLIGVVSIRIARARRLAKASPEARRALELMRWSRWV